MNLRRALAARLRHLATPLSITDSTRILVFQILRIRLDIQDVPKSRIRLGGTCCIWAGNRLQTRQSGVELRVFVENRGSLLRAGSSEVRLQNKRLRSILRRHRFIVTAMLALEQESAFGLHFVVEVVGTDRTETHRGLCILPRGRGLGLSLFTECREYMNQLSQLCTIRLRISIKLAF
jgi:hypothetical protein